MSLSATSFANLQLSMVHSATTKTRHAKTVSICLSFRVPSRALLTSLQVVKSVTANTTALSSVTSPLTSFAEFAEMQGIWQETVRTDSVEQTGATMLPVELCQVRDLLDALVEVTTSIVNTRYALWMDLFN